MGRELGVFCVSGAVQCIMDVLFEIKLFNLKLIYSRRLGGSAFRVFQLIAANGESWWIIATGPTLCEKVQDK